MGKKKTRARKGGVEQADKDHAERLRSQRQTQGARALAAAGSDALVRDLTAAMQGPPRQLEAFLAREDYLPLPAGARNFAGADRMVPPCPGCGAIQKGPDDGIVCAGCGVRWWCGAICRARCEGAHAAGCHKVKLVRGRVTRGNLRAVPVVQESGAMGLLVDGVRPEAVDPGPSPFLATAASMGDDRAVDAAIAAGEALDATSDASPLPPLVCAALEGHAAAARRLLAAGADPSAASHLGCTAALGAAQNGHADVVAVLGEFGADCDSCDASGVTPLGSAIEFANPPVVEALLKAGADPDRGSGPNQCPPIALSANYVFHYALEATKGVGRSVPNVPTFQAAELGVDSLPAAPPGPRVRVLGMGGDNKVFFKIDMALEDYVAKQVEILKLLVAAPGLRDVDGTGDFAPLVDLATAAALCAAIAAPCLECTRVLLAAGADPNAARRTKRADPNHAHYGGPGAAHARALLQSKYGGFLAPRDVERRGRSDDMAPTLTPLLALCVARRRDEAPRLDHYAALLEAGADPDRGIGAAKFTALMGAVVRDDAAVASALLGAGADPQCRHDLAYFKYDRFVFFVPDAARDPSLAMKRDPRAITSTSTLAFAEMHRPSSDVTALLRAAAGAPASRDRAAVAALSVSALKKELDARGISRAGCVEKSDLVDRLVAAPPPAPAAVDAACDAADRLLSQLGDEGTRAVRRLYWQMATSAPEQLAAARDFVATCHLPGRVERILTACVPAIEAEPPVGSSARTLWANAYLVRSSFHLQRRLRDPASAAAPYCAGFEGRVPMAFPQGYEKANVLEYLSNAAIDEPRALYAAIVDVGGECANTAFQSNVVLLQQVVGNAMTFLIGWEEQPELARATKLSKMPYARETFYVPTKSVYHRWAGVGATELLRVAEAQMREGHAHLARHWVVLAVRSLALLAAFENAQLFDAARALDLALEICEKARASRAFSVDDGFKTSIVKDSFMRTLRARCIEAYARVCGDTAGMRFDRVASPSPTDAHLRRQDAEMRAEMKRMPETFILDRAARHAEIIRADCVSTLERDALGFVATSAVLDDGATIVAADPSQNAAGYATTYYLVPFAVASFTLGFRARRDGAPADAAKFFLEAAFMFPPDDVRRPVSWWFAIDAKTRTVLKMRQFREIVAQAEGFEADFRAGAFGCRIANDDLACRARLRALVAATASLADDDVLDVDRYAPRRDAGEACANCGKTSRWDKKKSLQKCARCTKVAYCGPACQRAHWKVHKAVCRAAAPPPPPDAADLSVNMSIKELRAAAKARGVPIHDCLEKGEIFRRLKSACEDAEEAD